MEFVWAPLCVTLTGAHVEQRLINLALMVSVAKVLQADTLVIVKSMTSSKGPLQLLRHLQSENLLAFQDWMARGLMALPCCHGAREKAWSGTIPVVTPLHLVMSHLPQRRQENQHSKQKKRRCLIMLTWQHQDISSCRWLLRLWDPGPLLV